MKCWNIFFILEIKINKKNMEIYDVGHSELNNQQKKVKSNSSVYFFLD